MKPEKIRSVLIANRGEIAVRILRACRELGIQSTAVYSDIDRTSLHVRMADAAFPLDGSTAADTYLHQDKLIHIAKKARVEAIHPGYGFLSENPSFVRRVEEEGLIFIGPSADAIRTLGDKTEARKLANKLNIPTIAGTTGALANEEMALRTAEEVGFPVLLKAAAGGGGKGMRLVASGQELTPAFRTARSEAQSAFGDGRVYLEKYVNNPRHVEIQILADGQRNVIYLGERECSIQRRHQKIIEESPSTAMDEPMRKQMGEAAVALAKAAGYSNAGTVEFLVDEKKNYYFLEVNTRLQVEHPVTECVTGIDIVKQQFALAEGRRLSLNQADVHPRGHALECRIYAEDPANDFFPSIGTLRRYRLPHGPHVRVDNGFEEGSDVSVYYDPMLSKVISWGASREDAIGVMKRSLLECEIHGVHTTVPFCLFVMNHEKFAEGNFNTNFVQKYFTPESLNIRDASELAAAAVGGVLLRGVRGILKTSSTEVSKNGNKWRKLRTETYRS